MKLGRVFAVVLSLALATGGAVMYLQLRDRDGGNSAAEPSTATPPVTDTLPATTATSATQPRTAPARPTAQTPPPSTMPTIPTTARTTRASNVSSLCRRPRVTWDVPLGLALLRGFSQEAMDFFKSLQDKPVLLNRRPGYTESQFVNTLSARDRNLLSYLNGLKQPRPQVYVSQIAPPAYIGDLEAFLREIQPPFPGTVFRIGRWMFETNNVPQHWFGSEKYVDEVWVPSEFQREVFGNHNLIPKSKIKVVPEAVDCSVFDPAKYSKEASRKELIPQAENRFVFLTGGKPEPRKNFPLLIDSFLEEFGNELDKVMLVMRTDVSQSDLKRGQGSIVQMKSQSADNIPKVYRAADAFVIATHGEGFGRPPLEAMAMGLPTIATNWSGLTAYLRDDVAFPLPISGLESTVDDGGPHQWASIDKRSLRMLMRKVYKGGPEVAAVAARSRAFVKERFDLPVIGDLLTELLQQACMRVARRYPGEFAST